MIKVTVFAVTLIVVAFGCGRTGLDGGFATQNTTVGGSPDSGADALLDVGRPGTGGIGGSGGRAGSGGTGNPSGGAGATTGTIGGFNGTLQFCNSDLDCVAATPRCCPVGAVKVCEPGPCATNGDSDNDDDSAEGNRR